MLWSPSWFLLKEATIADGDRPVSESPQIFWQMCQQSYEQAIAQWQTTPPPPPRVDGSEATVCVPKILQFGAPLMSFIFVLIFLMWEGGSVGSLSNGLIRRPNLDFM